MIYEKIYTKLELLGILEVEDYRKVEVPGYMPLSIDRLADDRYAIAHNYIQNGDVMADPDMEIRVDVERKVAEAMSYTQHGVGVYRQVYSNGKIDVDAKKELNIFLDRWLTNLIAQGFGEDRR